MRLGIAVIVASLVAAVPALAGPPWIAIEYPANPFDPASRDAVLLVHAFHHGTEIDNPVTGTAEGLVGGERKSIKLEFKRTSRTGVFALTNQWGQSGDWTLVISTGDANHKEGYAAQALIQISSDRVLSVEVPTRMANGWRIPRPITAAEIDASLKNRMVRGQD